MLQIRPADFSDAQTRALIDTHITYGNAHYMAESNHHMTVDEHVAGGVKLFTAWSGQDCLGMVGLKPCGTWGELKSMHVRDTARGAGIGRALVEFVIEEAILAGLKDIYLETGSRDASAAARMLYETAGFSYCPPFGDYKLDPESVFMSRAL